MATGNEGTHKPAFKMAHPKEKTTNWGAGVTTTTPWQGRGKGRANWVAEGYPFWNLHQPNFMGLKSKLAWVVSHCSHLPRPHSLLMVALSCTASSPNSSVRAVWNCFPETDPILELPDHQCPMKATPVAHNRVIQGLLTAPMDTASVPVSMRRFWTLHASKILKIMTMSKLYQRDKIWLTGGAHPKKYFSLGMIIPNMLQPAEVNCAVHFSETRFFWDRSCTPLPSCQIGMSYHAVPKLANTFQPWTVGPGAWAEWFQPFLKNLRVIRLSTLSRPVVPHKAVAEVSKIGNL